LVDEKGDKLFIVVDQGGHASRAVIMNGSGRSLAWAERPLSTFHPEAGCVEHDPVELVQTIRQCLNDAVRKIGDRASAVQAVGFATQRSSILCWDNRTGEALTPVISWQDTRASERVRTMSSQAANIHGRTGLFLSAHYGASKISWCLENIPEVKKARQAGRLCCGPMSSFMVWQLTQEKRFVTDPVSASRTLLWNIFTKKWDPELLGLFNVPENVLPAGVPTIYRYGRIRLGRRLVPLKLVTGDQNAALYAFGKLRPETAYVNIGTGAFVSRPTGQRPVLASGLLTSLTHEQDGACDYVLEGTVNGAGSAIQWVQDTWKIKNVRELLPAWLMETVDPPLFLNGVSGLGSPYWMPDFASGFLGEGSDPDKVVAVVESIVFLLHRNIVEMGRHLVAPERIQITGGLSALDGICQKLADLTGIPVYRPVRIEATAVGTCCLLAGRPDHWPEPDAGKQFDPGDETAVARRFGRWVEEMEKKVGSKR